MPLDQCFAIISESTGSAFDPAVVDAFFAQRDEVEYIYREWQCGATPLTHPIKANATVHVDAFLTRISQRALFASPGEVDLAALDDTLGNGIVDTGLNTAVETMTQAGNEETLVIHIVQNVINVFVNRFLRPTGNIHSLTLDTAQR